MSKKVIIHENEYTKIKFNRQKKPRWLQEEVPVALFHTFTQKEQKTKNIDKAEQILSEIGLNFEILDQKYDGVTDSISCISDSKGRILWMNDFLKDLMFKDVKDIYMQPYIYQFIDLNASKPQIQEDLRNMLISFPKQYEINDNMTTRVGDFYLKILYERMDYKNGKPFGYFVTGKAYTTRTTTPNEKNQKSKKEIIEKKIQELEFDDSIFQDYYKSENQVIFVDFLGRLLWMNETFSLCNFKSEDDLMEGIYDEFGFEVFTRIYESVIKTLPPKFKEYDIKFKRIDSKNDKPIGYLVIFNTLQQVPQDKSPKELANSLLSLAGLSVDKLEEMYGKNENLHAIFSKNGRYVWASEYHNKVTKRTENDIMVPVVYLFLKNNTQNSFLVENYRNFLLNKGDAFSFSAETNIPNGGLGIGKFILKRIDSNASIPLGYHTEIVVNRIID